MTEGTKSYLIGCHQFFLHPLFVLLAWRLEYESWPKWWQTICIFLHDVGICGRQYLSDDKAKVGHWNKGAEWAFYIGYLLKRNNISALTMYYFCAGHTQESHFSESRLARADKRSWLVAPMWWLWWNYWVEWSGKGIGVTPPPKWRKLVAKNLKQKNPIGNHQLYLKHREKADVSTSKKEAL